MRPPISYDIFFGIMKPIHQNLFSMDFIFLIMLTICNFIIYFKTKNIYDITKEDSLKYFRLTFFNLSLMFLTMITTKFLPYFAVSPSTFTFLSLLKIYFSTVALIFLIYTFFGKKLKKKKLDDELIPHLIAIILVLTFLLLNSKLLILAIQGLIYIVFFTVGIINYTKQKGKKISVYYLLFVILFLFLFIGNLLEMLSYSNFIVSSIVYIVIVYVYIKLISSLIKKISI